MPHIRTRGNFLSRVRSCWRLPQQSYLKSLEPCNHSIVLGGPLHVCCKDRLIICFQETFTQKNYFYYNTTPLRYPRAGCDMMAVPAPPWAVSSLEAFVSLPMQQHGQHPSWQLDSSLSSPALSARGASGGVDSMASLSCSSVSCRRVCSPCRRYGMYPTDRLVHGMEDWGRSRSATLRRVILPCVCPAICEKLR